MLCKKLGTFFVVLLVTLTAAVSTSATTTNTTDNDKVQKRVVTPVNLAILIQDDLVSQVGNELDETRDFIPR